MAMTKIESCTRELRTLNGDESGDLYTGLKINGLWYHMKGDHRGLYGKTVDVIQKDKSRKIVALVDQQQEQATFPKLVERARPQGGYESKPKWSTREDIVEAYAFYLQELKPYIKEDQALVRAVNCIIMCEAKGDVKPVHRTGLDGSAQR